MEEGKQTHGLLYYYIKKEHKNEESLNEILDMLNDMDRGDKVHSFSISEEHIR